MNTSPDIVSLVVTLRPSAPVVVPKHLGHAVYALLMRWLDAYDGALAQRWHDSEGVKPFTCSNLIGGRRVDRHTRRLAPEDSYWLRLTGLEPELSAVLLSYRAQPPETVELEGHAFRVEGVTTDPQAHPWAGTANYEQLAASYLLNTTNAPRRLKLEFTSPTVFRHQGMHMPFPLPALTFGSLADRWNAFSAVAISPEVRRYGEQCVAVNNFRLRSAAVPLKDDVWRVGAVGHAHYVAVNYDRYWMAVLALLADFGRYGGVGKMTTFGLGQMRRLTD